MYKLPYLLYMHASPYLKVPATAKHDGLLGRKCILSGCQLLTSLLRC